MRYSTQIKPISYVKANAAELLDRINEEREPIIITQNGEARAVLMDVHPTKKCRRPWRSCKFLPLEKRRLGAERHTRWKTS